MLSVARRSSWDGVGQLLSTLCIAHCVLLPLVLGFLPAAEMLAGEAVHQGLLVCVALTAAVSFVPGWRLHRHAGVPVLAGAGLLLLLVAAFLLPEGESAALETGLTLGGSALMALAHARNRAMCRDCCALKSDSAWTPARRP